MDGEIAGRERAPAVFKQAELLEASPQTLEAYSTRTGTEEKSGNNSF